MRLDDAKLIIVFGGTFDPPTRAHVELPELARQRVGADLIAYVPAAQSPHKLDRPPTPPHHRLAMLRLALQASPHAVVLTDELDRAADGRPSYTVDTLRALRDRLPHVALRLLIGTDQVHAFDRWREPDEIVRLAEPLVMVRPPETRESLLAALPASSRETWAQRLVEIPPLPISATDVREHVAAGHCIRDLVPPAVADYIAEHGLYGKIPRTR